MKTSLRILTATSIVVIAGLVLATSSFASFGVTEFTAKAINENGTLDTQAGGHPYEATTSFTFNQSTSSEYPGDQPGNVKDVEVELPSGFIGDPRATPQCPESQFEGGSGGFGGGSGGCPIDTQVGVVTLTFGGYLAGPDTQPVYNIVPKPGVPAEFGFNAVAELVRGVIVADVNPGSGYQLVTKSSDIPTGGNQEGDLPLLSVSFTFWGIPADPSHDAERGQRCEDQSHFGGGCANGGQSSDAPLTPFLTNPTNCQSGPLATTLRADSWQNPGHYLTYTAMSPQPTGCEKLAFHPTLSVEPETAQADSPSGYTFRVKVPQNPNPYGLETPELDNAKVTLPRGVSIDPSAANGLAGCTDEQVGIGTENPVTCPSASKLGTVEVFTPLLADGPNGEAPLTGSIYLGTPISGDEYRIFLVMEGHGVSIRLPGKISADTGTGQLTATFQENPPLPFNELVLRLFGGPHAALANPLSCGPATTTSDLTPYGSPEVPDATPASTFQVTGCGNPAPFTPSLVAGSTSPLAGAYSPFTFQLSRGDGQQYISQIATVSLPPGLLGNISAIPLCGSSEAAAGTCGPLSQIGQVTVGAGPGASPFYLGGKVYLTQGYDGDPFGLSVVVPAIAGPYDLGTVVVRAGVQVNSDGTVTVHADPVPTILEGIPLRLRYIGITLERPDFMLNPTNCTGHSIIASVLSQQGSTAGLSSPFVASGCAALPFRPLFVASTTGSTSKHDGASLDVRVAQGGGEANIRRVDVQLPTMLPSRLTTLQQACTEAQFNANPAGCPEASNVGIAKAVTPILSVPLTGPAYLVSHGGAKFPELVLILQGEGVTIDLRGETDIKGTITYSRFETIPDAPITSFELYLPQGPHSVLASPDTNLCGKTLTMPTSMEGQNGAKTTQNTLISVTGCTAAKAKALTRAQKLAQALKACKKKPKQKRAACQARARKQYATKATAKQSSNHNKKAGR
jgi:hypothetical protein